MFVPMWTFATTTALLFSAEAGDPPVKDEMAKLAGTWQMTACEQGRDRVGFGTPAIEQFGQSDPLAARPLSPGLARPVESVNDSGAQEAPQGLRQR